MSSDSPDSRRDSAADDDGAAARLLSAAADMHASRGSPSALDRSAHRLDAIINNTKMAVFMMDERQQCVFMNKAAEELTGYSFDETRGRSLHDVIHHTRPDGRPYPAAECPIDRAFPEENQVEGRETFVHKDGHFYPVAFTASPIRDETGKPVGTVIEARNIADELARDAALRENEQRFRAVFENAGVGMIEIDSEWTILGSNRVYSDITRFSPEELAGRSSLSFTHPDDIERSERALRSVRSGEVAGVSFEKRYVRKDGEIVWIRSNVASLGDERDRFLKIVEDISERKAVETALREERHNLEILNNIGSSLAGELDLERVVQMVTDAGVDLTGAKFGAFFYNVLSDAGESYMLYTLSGAERSQFDKFGMPRNTEVFAHTFEGAGIVRSDDITKDPRYGQNPPHKGMPEGHLPVRSYLALPVVGRTGEVIGGLFFGHPDPGMFEERHETLMAGIAAQAAIAIDNARLFQAAQREIEQRVRAEQALTALNETLESRVIDEIERRSRAEEALRQAQKMETVGQLSGGIAHDFNNLLQVIHGNLSLLQNYLPAGEEKWQRAVRNALSGADRAAALTRRLLAFSRRQPLEPRPVDLNRLVADMADLLQRTLGETVRVDMRLAKGAIVAEVDPNQLENSILNLAINARDAMPSGGALTIATDAVELDEDFLRLHPDAPPGKYVRLTVADTGIGMDPAILSRAIEPFFTTKEVGRGTGLGLSMVYGFVRQSGGLLDLHSTPGEGTRVELFLPCSKSPVGPHERPELAGVPRGNGETILLCEDDVDVRTFSAESLDELGYNVLSAHDGPTALELLREATPVDLLFTDVVLPGGMTGADLAREARRIQPGLKVLFATGYARDALDDATIDGGVEVLPKPFSVGELAQRLRRILR